MKFVVPLTIPNTFSISVAARLSWITRMTGTTPATDASKRSWTPASRAAAKSSSPNCAISCLLAVTTWRPARRARSTYSRAGSVPPISSTTISERSRMPSKSPSARRRTPTISGLRPAAASMASARSASRSWSAPPTVPSPSSPIFAGSVTSRATGRGTRRVAQRPRAARSPPTAFAQGSISRSYAALFAHWCSFDIPRHEIVEGLAADDQTGVSGLAEHHGRARHTVVVRRHRVAVCAGGGGDEDVAGAWVGEHRVRHEDVARLAVHAGDGGQRVGDLRGAVGDDRLVARAVEHRAQVVGHPAIHRQIGPNPGDLLHRADLIGGYAGVADQRSPRLDQDPGHGIEDAPHPAHLDVDVALDRGRLVGGRVG